MRAFHARMSVYSTDREREHLFVLAGARGIERTPAENETVSELLQRVLHSLDPSYGVLLPK